MQILLPVKSIFLLATALILFPFIVVAQLLSSRHTEKLSFSGFPVIYYSPETKLTFGGAGILELRRHNDSLHPNP